MFEVLLFDIMMDGIPSNFQIFKYSDVHNNIATLLTYKIQLSSTQRLSAHIQYILHNRIEIIVVTVYEIITVRYSSVENLYFAQHQIRFISLHILHYPNSIKFISHFNRLHYSASMNIYSSLLFSSPRTCMLYIHQKKQTNNENIAS